MVSRNTAPANFKPAKVVLAAAVATLNSYRRDQVLEAVAMAAKELLRSSDLSVSLPKVIERIGPVTAVDRMHIFLMDSKSLDGGILEHHLWSAPGVMNSVQGTDTTASLTAVGLGSWVSRLAQHETIFGHVRDFDPAARKFFKSVGVKSVLSVPIFAEERWLGIIGFDDCRSERDWSAAEIDVIETLAELVAAAIARTARIQSLADANRIVENSPTIIYRLSPREPFELIYISQNTRRYGYEAEKLLAAPGRWLQLVEPKFHATIAADIKSILKGRTKQTLIEFPLKKPDGSHVWFEGRGYPVRDTQGRLTAIEGILTDITERKRAERQQAFSRVLLSTAIEGSPDAVLAVDIDNKIIMSNRHFAELWKLPPELLRSGNDQPVLKAVAAQMKNVDAFLARVKYLYEHPDIQSHEELELTDGRFIDRHSGSLYDPQHKYLGRVWFFRDITEKKLAEKKIAELARTDSLTGLPNRDAFLDRLALEFARARRGTARFAVHYLDLDHFKDVNDTLGHPVGDELLRLVAERLRGCVRETDMVARFGGDEFAVLQDDVDDVSAVETLAEKIGRALADPYKIGGNQVSTSASIGIVPYRAEIANINAMMMKADLALYRAKSDGRNRFRFHVQELDEETRERMAISEDLRHAVARGQFELYYQPQIDLKAGAIIGLEALLRWNHPKRGRLLPDAFIGIAETTGSILAIGDWVIAEACRQIHAWGELALAPPVVAVNMSGAQFKLAAQLDQVVFDNLKRHGVAPEQLELELTESVLFDTTKRHGETLERLRRLGVRFTIDDFGTGYSSLDYLRAYRVTRLKIAPRFIADVTTSADNAAITRATIGLAHALGIEVLAEGVETAAQRDFLLAAGCEVAQGFYFAEPMPAKQATEMLQRSRRLVAV